jgi:hypothetical protein
MNVNSSMVLTATGTGYDNLSMNIFGHLAAFAFCVAFAATEITCIAFGRFELGVLILIAALLSFIAWQLYSR